MKTQKIMPLFAVFALAFVWMIAPAAAAEPVKKPATAPLEIETDTEETELPEV